MIQSIWHECYIALGSNMDDPRYQIQSALKHLSLLKNTLFLKSSPIYKSKPWGYTAQNDFLNAVAFIKTLLSPEELLSCLKDIEIQQGRISTFRNGPRSIDLDLILFGNIESNTPTLTLPHPRFHERDFVIIPLFDLHPDLILPQGLPLKDLRDRMSHNPLKLIDVSLA